MPCYHPLEGWRGKEVNPVTGKRRIVFDRRQAWAPDAPLALPCGQCIGCRLERSRQWAIRCVHESKLYDKNCFITLTYRDECLPSGGTLELRDFQLFMKRLRKAHGSGIRFFHCGEYGELFQRPHYHACLFNFDVPDRDPWKEVNGIRLYKSRLLDELWGLGFTSVGDVTFDSAAYVARYITKKITGERADEHYVNRETGELRAPEYVTMSRRPGIGREWFNKYCSDVYPDDFIVLKSQQLRPPKYYDNIFELVDPEAMARIKASRKSKMKAAAANSTWERLAVREEIQLRKFDLLKRGYENEF